MTTSSVTSIIGNDSQRVDYCQRSPTSERSPHASVSHASVSGSAIINSRLFPATTAYLLQYVVRRALDVYQFSFPVDVSVAFTLTCSVVSLLVVAASVSP